MVYQRVKLLSRIIFLDLDEIIVAVSKRFLCAGVPRQHLGSAKVRIPIS